MLSLAFLIICISSITMVGFSIWAMKALTFRILYLAQVITVSQVQAFLLVCTTFNVQVMALPPSPAVTPHLSSPTGLHLQSFLPLLSSITLLAPPTALLIWGSLSPSFKVSNSRSATTLGCFLLLSGLPRQWCYRVAVARQDALFGGVAGVGGGGQAQY